MPVLKELRMQHQDSGGSKRAKMSLLSVHEERYQADPHARKSQVHIIKTQ
jgi:hypothetical protein